MSHCPFYTGELNHDNVDTGNSSCGMCRCDHVIVTIRFPFIGGSQNEFTDVDFPYASANWVGQTLSP